MKFNVRQGGVVMSSVKDVFITKEAADMLNINSAYLIRLAKKLREEGLISDDDMRTAGIRNYIFNKKAIKVLESKITKNK